MKESIYKNYDELPLFLNAATVAKVLGIAPSSSYELMHEKDFPALRIGNRIVVPKEAFIRWVEHHNVWTIIYSLRREDAARLDYDNAASWRALLRSKQADFAEAMQIPPSQLRWYAAFHDEGEHPHIHMMLWSDDPKYGFLRKDKLLHLQSILTNMIYADELKAVYVQKDIAYKDVTGAARETMRRIVDRLESVKNPPESIQKKMMELVLELRTITGKSSMDISESRSRIWWIPSWMNWKKCRRLLRIMPSGTTCAIRWRATTRTVLGSTTHSHSRKNSEPSRAQSFRKRSVCGSRWSRNLHRVKNRLRKKLLETLLQIRRLQMKILRPQPLILCGFHPSIC